MIRLDDLTPGGRSLRFDDPVAQGRAHRLGDVVGCVEMAEARARDGEWVVFVLAYEAASALDPAMRTAPSPPPGVPYAWWQSFTATETVARPAPTHSRVVQRSRRPNRHPYPDAVQLIRERIARGDVYQVNVTDRFEGVYAGTALDTYRALIGVQTCAFGAYVEMDDRIVASASPELFFRWDDDIVTCRPMKGTAPRHPRAGLDDAVGSALAGSAKDRAENVMIVDLLRNDLGRIARTGTVSVPTLFALERYETVWQLTSTVRAHLPPTATLTSVLRALFPCGSVTGAPKIAAMDVIAELEAEPRGVYCGAIGLLCPDGHGPRAVCSVPIRTAVLDPSTATFEYGAGAGITWSSDPEAEDAEVRDKARILTRSHRELSLLETLRLDEDGLHHLDLHLERLAASAHWFGFPFERPRAVGALAGIEPLPNAERVRLLLDPHGVVAVEREALVETLRPVRLAVDDVVSRSDDPFCCHKTTWRRHYDDARARHPDADDVVLVNQNGNVIETTIANLAARIDGRWWCPPLDDGGLAGIARRVAIESGRLAERSLTPADLAAADELAVLNDLRGWRHAVLLS